MAVLAKLEYWCEDYIPSGRQVDLHRLELSQSEHSRQQISAIAPEVCAMALRH